MSIQSPHVRFVRLARHHRDVNVTAPRQRAVGPRVLHGQLKGSDLAIVGFAGIVGASRYHHLLPPLLLLVYAPCMRPFRHCHHTGSDVNQTRTHLHVIMIKYQLNIN